MITLQEVANAATRATGRTFWPERLGGNVWGAVDYTGRTVTIDDGAREASGAVELLICDDGAEVLRAEVRAAVEVELLLGTL